MSVAVVEVCGLERKERVEERRQRQPNNNTLAVANADRLERHRPSCQVCPDRTRQATAAHVSLTHTLLSFQPQKRNHCDCSSPLSQSKTMMNGPCQKIINVVCRRRSFLLSFFFLPLLQLLTHIPSTSLKLTKMTQVCYAHITPRVEPLYGRAF